MTARIVPLNYARRWIECAVTISTKNYMLFLACGLFCFITVASVSRIPYLGILASYVLYFLYILAQMRLTEKFIENKDELSFEYFLRLTFDQELIRKMRLYIVAILAMGLLQIAAMILNLAFLSLPIGFINFFVVLFCAYAAFNDLGKDQAQPDVSLKGVLMGIQQNIKPFLLFILCYFGLAIISTTLCVIPLLFCFIPMILPANYLVFASIFRGLDVDRTMKEWSFTKNEKPL